VDGATGLRTGGISLAWSPAPVHTGGSIDVAQVQPEEDGPVVVRHDDPLERVPMSWEQYLHLPERPRAEWVDGVAVIMNAPVSFGHGASAVRLASTVLSAVPELYVVSEVKLKMSDDLVRAPDIMVTDSVPADARWVSEPPLMVAEVLSRSTKSEDVLVKSAEYARFGIGQYWILDPENRTLEVMRNVEGGWHTLALLDDDNPEVTVVLAGRPVSVDLRQVLRA
jgi:Uma2 family endonuclease